MSAFEWVFFSFFTGCFLLLWLLCDLHNSDELPDEANDLHTQEERDKE